METLIKEALATTETQEEKQEERPDLGELKILVVGVGGAGNNSVNRMAQIGVVGAKLVAVNTDRQHLERMSNDLEKILIGESLTNGLGAGGYPDVGARAAEIDKERIEALVKDTDLVFVICGLGGGTGTGASPVISEAARMAGALVISISTLPFSLEKARIDKALQGLEKMKVKNDSIILIDNNRLLDIVPNLPLDQAFFVADEVISKAVKGLIEVITMPSTHNIDFGDVRSIMQNGGISLISIGEGRGNAKIEQAIDALFKNKLLDVEIKDAKNALIHFSGGNDLSLGELNNACESLSQKIGLRERMVWGARVSQELEGKIEIILIITGIDEERVTFHFEPKTSTEKEDELGIGYIE